MRIRKIVLTVCVLAIILAGILLWTLPADVGYRYARPHLGPITLTGIGGTVWNGHADGASVLGYDLGEMDWHLSKVALLLHGEFTTTVRVKGANVNIAGNIVRDSDRVTAHDLRFSVPAALLEPLLDVGDAKMYGTIDGVIAHATWFGGTLSLADVAGNAQWNDGKNGGKKTNGLPELPSLLADFASQPDGSITGTLRDDAHGNLAVDGTFTLRLPGSIDAQLRFSARNGDALVTAALRYLGTPQPDGSALLTVHERTSKAF